MKREPKIPEVVDNHLLFSKYQLELSSEEAIQRFLEEKIREVDDG